MGRINPRKKNHLNHKWMVARGYNGPLYPTKKMEGFVDYIDNMVDLENIFTKQELIDMELGGSLFT